VQVKPEQKRMVGWGDATDTLNALETAVSGRDFIAGDAFTAADVYIGAQIGWGMQFGAIDKRPAFERYSERMASRPAAIRAREIDDKLLAA
jgi:glutathione S-transferase